MSVVGAILPGWLAVLLAGVGMVLIASYVLALQKPEIPPSRRRIRTAGGVVQMFLVGAIVYAARQTPPSDKRLFVLAWMLVILLTLLVLTLALLDIANNLRLGAAERRAQLRQAAELIAKGRPNAAPTHPPPQTGDEQGGQP